MTNRPAESFRCPTCGAGQELSDQCRRCKCDLSLVLEIHERRAALYESTLQRLKHGDTTSALTRARQLCSISADPETARLLAVCQLLAGDYRAAFESERRGSWRQ